MPVTQNSEKLLQSEKRKGKKKMKLEKSKGNKVDGLIESQMKKKGSLVTSSNKATDGIESRLDSNRMRLSHESTSAELTSTVRSPRQSPTYRYSQHRNNSYPSEKDLQRSHQNMRYSLSSQEDVTYQGILHNAMIGMMSVLLQYTASRTLYNKSDSLLSTIDHQAESIVEEELGKLLSNQPNIMTAYSQLTTKLVAEIKSSIIEHPDRERLHELSDHLSSLRVESQQAKSDYSQTLARKEQEIEALRAEIAINEAKNQSLITAVELLEKDLQTSRMSVTDLQQEKMLLKLKALQYKGEVDRTAAEVQKNVKNKIGFIPRNIETPLTRLSSLPPPVEDSPVKGFPLTPLPSAASITPSAPSSTSSSPVPREVHPLSEGGAPSRDGALIYSRLIPSSDEPTHDK